MIFKIKTTKNTGDCLKTLRKNLRFPANILSRIAIAMSLKSESLNKDEIYKYYETYDSEGHEFSRYILFGEYEIVYKLLMEEFCSSKLSDEEFFQIHTKFHIENGMKMLSNEYKLANTQEKLIKSLIREVPINKLDIIT